MYNYTNRDKFYHDDVDKTYIIMYENDDEESEEEYSVITNDDIDNDNFEIYDGITDQSSLNFQNALSTYIKFITRNVDDTLYGKILSVWEVLGNDTENPIPIGSFTVQSENMSVDGETKEIIAYDAMYDIINTEVTDWYNSLDFPITIKDFRDSFFYMFDIEQDNESLINDDISIPKQLSETDIIGGDAIVKALAELNGVFPHIGKDGLMHWITLDTGDIYETALYPSLSTYPGEATYPGTGYDGEYVDIYKHYYKESSVIYSSFITEKPDGVQIRNEYNEIAYYEDNGSTNPYIVINNFLCYGLSSGQYEQIAKRLYKKIKGICYVPFEMVKMADPCIEPGDRVVIHAETNIQFLSYVFNKHTTGIRVAFENIQTNGTYTLSQYDVGGITQSTTAKLKNLDNRVGNIEKSGSGPLQIVSVATLPDSPQLNVLYLIQGEVTVS